ncbi:lipopolysaccharide biosynthesis protein [Lacicoccus alkaliphilus]|uniref:Membrane protein involved in the export of O-antigen and teichoic acid n=1 Tax=Lacicoccus alkaliphilus DSM 16010 TaxID=1123231 RepID=A0A1M7CTY0_9BACL|nr:hypothetical protein [Salinicoccus alkaliphilus]SHL70686.1 Membrane protein involved in the export of O-antigen and teichoic acid [Salinicoccus alkaliphilus DSM 16010]
MKWSSGVSMRSRSLNVAGTLFMAVNQWLQVILITRLLGLYEVGLFTYFLALMGPLVLFTRFSLARLVPTQKKLAYDYIVFKKFREVMNVSFIGVSILLILFVDLNLYESLCLFIFVLFRFYENKEEFIYTENIAESRVYVLGLSRIIRSIVIIILFTSSILIFESLFMAILSLLVSQMLVYHLFDRRFSVSGKRPDAVMTFKHFKNIFLLGMGLAVVELISSLVTNIPRYVLEHFHSVEVLGVFATIMYFTIITNNVVVAINEGVIAALAREATVSPSKFYRSFFKLCGVFLVLIIIGEIILIFFGNDILVLVYGPEFIGYQREMVLLGVLLFFIVYTTLLEMALNIFNLYMHQVVMQTMTLIATVILSLLVIIPFGLTGAFIVGIVTHAILMMMQIGVLMHDRKVKRRP